MTVKQRLLTVLILMCALAPAALAAGAARNVTVLYADRADDPFYDGARGYAGIYSIAAVSPYPGAELAIKDAKLVGEAVGVDFTLEHLTLDADADAPAAIAKALDADHAGAVLLDLPLDDTLKTATALAGRPVALFNARHRDTSLRLSACRTQLFHTMPSWDMLEDALAQGLARRNWRRILTISGGDAEDKAVAAAFKASAAKFGLTVTAEKSFVPGADPRDRDKNNPRLITAESDYDVVFVADRQGDFARYLPFNTQLPRPVVGAAGLMPSAWHPYWERQGAPQLNRRFERAAKRLMTDLDWSAWAAVRAIVEATVRGKPSDNLATDLLDPALTLELYKGNPGSFRPWNRQLRQPLLLGSETVVAGTAPVEGMLHRTNTLDTLGLDEPEFHCP